ncbi:MAG: alpha-ketoglutarate-dependent dioxygenase AlkB [Aquimonas sp.]|nr:alpha-ketoglutarate-dependent dioxygenase AlkB [Aquimonas sp.]
MEWIEINLPGAELRIAPQFLGPQAADAALSSLIEEIPWEQHRIRLYGREHASPRLSCWIGDPGASYTYSRTRFEPRPWTPELQGLRQRVEAACGTRFNSVLANLYRDGGDGMGWHADDEPELGLRPMIASLSLGAARGFAFRDRAERRQRLKLELPHGSLLLMAGQTQALYQHALPKSARPLPPRLNLTFRHIAIPSA